MLALGGAVVLGGLEGGFPKTVWYPAAMFALVLLVMSLVLSPPMRPHGAVLLGLLAYALFVAWSYASMLWAESPGDAWDGSNRALFYGLVLAVVTLRPWSGRAATIGLGIVAFGTAATALAVLAVGATATSAANLFAEGRLAEPAGYSNATANLWLLGVWPAVFLASAHAVPRLVRMLAVAALTVLLEMLVLAQSRGALITLVVSGVAFIALTPRRWSALAVLSAAAALGAPSFNTLAAVRETSRIADLGDALDGAALAIGASAVGALFLGAVVIALEPAAVSRLGAGRRARRAGNVALTAIVIGALVGAAIQVGNPQRWVEDRWDDFKSPSYGRVESGRTRFTGGLGSGRYDFYRVALKQFGETPVAGIGTDNFAAAYLRDRRTDEAPRYPHSLAMKVLSELGLIGTALLVVTFALLIGRALNARRAAAGDAAVLLSAALSGFLSFLVQAQMDWLWEFPALGALAFGMLGLAVGFGSHEEQSARRPRRLGVSAGTRAALGFVAIAAAVSLAVPGVAARYTEQAYEAYRVDPQLALRRLDRAADLNPTSSEPLVAAGVIERRLGHRLRAARSFRKALSRRPDDWFSYFELGVIQSELGETASARRSLERARELNPRQGLVDLALVGLRRGVPLDLDAKERQLVEVLRDRLRPTERPPDATRPSN